MARANVGKGERWVRMCAGVLCMVCGLVLLKGNAIRLGHINDRKVEVREDIHASAHDGEHRSESQCNNQNDDRDGAPKGDTNKPHRS